MKKSLIALAFACIAGAALAQAPPNIDTVKIQIIAKSGSDQDIAQYYGKSTGATTNVKSGIGVATAVIAKEVIPKGDGISSLIASGVEKVSLVKFGDTIRMGKIGDISGGIIATGSGLTRQHGPPRLINTT